MTENILAEIKGSEIVLADGKTYKLPPRDINTLAALEEAFDCSLDKFMEKFEKRQASAFRLLLFTLLKQNHPELTLEDVGKLIPIDKLAEISEIIAKTLS